MSITQHTATIDLRGGLGNQLFQVFTLFAFCYDYDMTPVLPAVKTCTVEIPPRKLYWDSFLSGLAHYVVAESEHAIEYREPRAHYDPFPLFLCNNSVMFSGPFMSHMYFDRWRERVLTEMGLRTVQDNLAQKYPFIFTESGVRRVSMHFRLGDYINKRCYHPIMPVSYYVDAMTQLMRETPDKSIQRWVFYCFFERANEAEINQRISQLYRDISPEFKFELRKVPQMMTDDEELTFMSMCDDNVLANSTFSWWGAYMNNNATKRVMYPSVWYGHQLYYLASGDMFPCTWNKVVLREQPGCDCSLSRDYKS
jgi:hypothetical protein